MGNCSKFPTCHPFSMLLSDYSQINLGDSTIKFSPCSERVTTLSKTSEFLRNQQETSIKLSLTLRPFLINYLFDFSPIL